MMYWLKHDANRTSWRVGVFFTGCLLLFTSSTLAAATPRQINLKLTDINGTPHAVADYHGKWLVISIWATWCATCIQELPELIRFHHAHQAKDAVVLGIHYDLIGKTELLAFANQHRINFPLFSGMNAIETALGPVAGVPKTYLIAPDGTLRVIFDGPVTAQEIEEETLSHQKAHILDE